MRILFVLALASSPAVADVYRCNVSGKTVYQDWPCSNAKLVENANAIPPSAIDQQKAKQRAANERAFLARQKMQRDLEAASSSITLTQRAIPGPTPTNNIRRR